MNREQAKQIVENIEFVKAFAEGKEVEFAEHTGSWVALANPYFYEPSSKYRIKSEPKYVPYETVEEAQHLLGQHIMRKNRKEYELVTYIGLDSYTGKLRINNNYTEVVFKEFTLVDGTPIGKKVDA